MINWDETTKQFGLVDLSKYRPRVIMQCDKCGARKPIQIKNKGNITNNQMPWTCNKCIRNSDNYKSKRSTISKKLWGDEKYKELVRKAHTKACKLESFKDKVSQNSKKLWKNEEHKEKMAHISEETQNKPGYKDKISRAGKVKWQDQEFREKIINSHNAKEFKDKQSKKMQENWRDSDYRAAQNTIRKTTEYKNKYKTPKFKEITSNNTKKLWENEEYRKKITNAKDNDQYRAKIKAIYDSDDYKSKMVAARANAPKISSLQITLYSILDDLGVKYYREYEDHTDPECTIGPYNWDCVIPRENKPALLIECQGEYWHSLDRNSRNDKSKSSYINNNFPGKYEIKQIWEHEFKCKDRIIETIKYWLEISQLEIINFDCKNVIIKNCLAQDYKLLLSKYHYLSNAGRGGITYGAYLGEELIGVCIFSPLVRQNIRTGNYKPEECRELSRLCIHPKYQKKNFTSWFVSRCIKQLDPKYKLIISYCDTTFNHDGAIYKACNFKEDGVVPPDYWYVNESGWVMHKKTLYNHAVSMKMKEADYAERHGYNKTYGQEKLRFIYER